MTRRAPRLIAAVRWECALQARNGLYAVTALIVVFWLALAGLLPPGLAPGLLVPAFVALNLLVTTFYFVAALVLLERDEGVVEGLAVSPLRREEYLAAKVVTLSLLGAGESLAVVAWVFGGEVRWPPLLAGTLLLAAFYVLAGFAAVAGFASLNAYLVPSSLLVVALVLPLAAEVGVLPRWPFVAHPFQPFFTLLRAGVEPIGAGGAAYAATAGLAWIAVAAAVARRRFPLLLP